MSEISDTVTGINIFPIKSCQAATVEGQPPTSLDVTDTGFTVGDARDRDWLLVDDSGLFVSQRAWNKRRRIDPAFQNDRKLATVAVDIQEDSLVVNAQGFGSLEIPSRYPQHVEDGQKSHASIHEKNIWTIDAGNEPAEFFTRFLGRGVRLVRADRENFRTVDDGRLNGASNVVAAADGLPFLLASQASLDYLHDLKGVPRGTMPLNRFRANIEIDGSSFGPFGEDYLRTIRIGNMAAAVVKACARCPIPNIDQISGEEDNLMNKLLYPVRQGSRYGEDELIKKERFFGQNLNHTYLGGEKVSIGDSVEILRINSHPNIALLKAFVPVPNVGTPQR